ncbi:MAG: CHRD domain-containing protein [Gaiellaceae bacterium]
MRKLWVFTAAVLLAGLVAGAAALAGRGSDDDFETRLNGYNEVASKSTVARGSFKAELDDGVIRYRLSYRNLETPALFAHIHFGQAHTNGGVIAFLCGGGGKPDCPETTGTVRGTIMPGDIVGPGPNPANPAADQGIEPGNFREAVRALRAGAVYANVHSERFPGGEIRGQVKRD